MTAGVVSVTHFLLHLLQHNNAKNKNNTEIMFLCMMIDLT